MPIEKISAAEQLNVIPTVETRTELEEKAAPQPKGNTKDVITALSVLSAIGAAGVAIYKHKNAKKMIEEAEKSANKKVEEAEEKAKKAAEDAENKIKEMAEKIRDEYEKNFPKAEDTSKGSKKTKVKKNKKNKQQNAEVDEVKPRVLEGNILDKNLKKVDETFLNNVKESENGIIVIPKSTKLAEFFTKVNNFIKRKIKRTPKQEVSPSQKTETSEKKISKLKTFGTKISDTAHKTKDYITEKWNKFLGIFNRKKAVAPPLQKTEEGEKIKQNIRNKLSGKPDYEKLTNELVKEPHTQAEHDRIQARYNTLAVKDPKLSEIFKGIKTPNVTQMAEKDLMTEYNALLKTVKDLSAEAPEAKRFLEIKGELLNHRGYKVQPDGQIKKVVSQKTTAVTEDIPLKDLSDIDLLIEYNLLRKKVQKLSVMSPEALRFLEIQGELLNHRGYKIQPDNKVKKIGADNISVIERIKRFFRF